MRKITSREADERKAKRNRMILGFFLVFIMFFSVAEYAFLSNPDTPTNPEANSINYNGFKFTPQNGYWILNKDGTNFIFRYNPNQVEMTNSSLNNLESYKNKPLFIKTQNLASESELRTNLAPFVNGIIITDNEKCGDNTIIIAGGTESPPLQNPLKNQSRIYQKENCVYIESAGSDSIKLTDEFLFQILEIRE